MATKRELLQENKKLRRRLEEVYDISSDGLGFEEEDDDNEDNPEDDRDGSDEEE